MYTESIPSDTHLAMHVTNYDNILFLYASDGLYK